MVAGGFTILGYALSGTRLAIFVGFTFVYIAVFGQWEPSMETLSFVLIAAPVSVFFGLMLGVWAFKSKTVEAVLNPLLNVMQIMPAFSYLIPVMIFFGIGDHAGAIATVIFATPPMVRLTLLGLQKLSPEIAEAGQMSGCTDRQLMFKVLIPTARRDILIGVNQVIMQCLAMVVIASLIGAKGLGNNLLIALNQLRIGLALELGVCIVLIAIVLDRLSLAWANKQIDYFADLSFVERHKYSLIFGIIFVVGIILAIIGSFIFKEGFNYLNLIPHNKGITTQDFWQAGVDWIWDTFFYTLKYFNEWLIVEVLVPVKKAYLAMPVVATFLLTMGTGYIVGGWKVALTVGGLLLFIAFTEWWDRALITAYLMTIAVLISSFVGIVAGTLCAQHPVIYAYHADSLRYLSDFPIIHLPDSGNDAVWCHRYFGADRHRNLRHRSSHPLHHTRIANCAAITTRCGLNGRRRPHTTLFFHRVAHVVSPSGTWCKSNCGVCTCDGHHWCVDRY